MTTSTSEVTTPSVPNLTNLISMAITLVDTSGNQHNATFSVNSAPSVAASALQSNAVGFLSTTLGSLYPGQMNSSIPAAVAALGSNPGSNITSLAESVLGSTGPTTVASVGSVSAPVQVDMSSVMTQLEPLLATYAPQIAPYLAVLQELITKAASNGTLPGANSPETTNALSGLLGLFGKKGS